MPPQITRRTALAALAGLVLSGCSTRPRIVLYCAQDQPFAKGVLKDFTDETKLDVAPKFDTEATKSVGLYNEIVAEGDKPRCDVFWNNEILNTLRLQKQGLLAAYPSPSAKPFPDWTKGKDHAWQAFAGRARVLIVNTKLLAAEKHPKSLLDLPRPDYKDRLVMAKPLFGTTATQAACLFEVLGEQKARDFFKGLKDNGVQIASGNKEVAERVGQGKNAIGLTDTDDAIDEVNAGRDVAILFPDSTADQGRMGTLFIPNTLMLLAGAPNPDGGRKLIDYLLSPPIEKKLAEGPSAQIPLNPDVEAKLPAAIEAGRKAKAMKVDWLNAAALWDKSQEFLTKEFAT